MMLLCPRGQRRPEYSFIYLFACLFIGNLGGSHREDMTAGWLLSIRGSSPSPLSSECMFCPPSTPTVGAVSRVQPWESNMRLRPPGPYMWLSPSEIWPVAEEMPLSFSPLGQASDMFLARYACHRPAWVGLPLPVVSPCPLWMGPSLWDSSWRASQDTKKQVWERSISRGKSDLASELYVGRGSPECWMLADGCVSAETPQSAGLFNVPVWGMAQEAGWLLRWAGLHGGHFDWPLMPN